jgi:predicted metal-dependent HD superfamily phosphohydrolase
VAIWFHDVIYQPYFKNNEERSVHYFQKHCSENSNLKKEDKVWIEQAIFSTFGHHPRLDDASIRIFLDLDLAILATDWNTYQTYTRAIRKEYWIYPKSLYQNARKKAMQHFLERENIYFTEVFKVFEQQARANIQREIEGLNAS